MRRTALLLTAFATASGLVHSAAAQEADKSAPAAPAAETAPAASPKESVAPPATEDEPPPAAAPGSVQDLRNAIAGLEEISNETAFQALARLVLDRLDNMTSPGAVAEKDAAAQADLLLLDLQGDTLREALERPAKHQDKIKEIKAIAENAALPEATRREASYQHLQILSASENPDGLNTALQAHLKSFPSDERNKELQVLLLHELSLTAPDEALALAKKLLKSDDEETKSMAQSVVDLLGSRAELQKAPLDLKVTLLDGKELDFATLRGKVVLIDFWATWCAPCMEAMPGVKAAYEKYQSKGLEIVGISLDENKDEVSKVTAKAGMVWPQAYSGKMWDDPTAKRFGVDAIPAVILVDKTGKIIDFNAGQDLEKKLAKLLGE
jgi:thiol-disulfide isomerase/thioredoxin